MGNGAVDSVNKYFSNQIFEVDTCQTMIFINGLCFAASLASFCVVAIMIINQKLKMPDVNSVEDCVLSVISNSGSMPETFGHLTSLCRRHIENSSLGRAY